MSPQHAAWQCLRSFSRWTVHRDLDPSIEGLDQVPRSGPVILASRHVHHLYDACLLLSLIPRRLHVVAAIDWPRTAVARSALRTACDIALWPTVIRPSSPNVFSIAHRRQILRQALPMAMDGLEQGNGLIVFPEAFPIIDPSPSPRDVEAAILPFARGAADLAWLGQRRLGSPIPIIPVGLDYAEPRPNPGLHRWPVAVRFGAPIEVRHGNDRDHATEVLQRQVAELSGLGEPVALLPRTSR